jgi:hypothetical protein
MGELLRYLEMRLRITVSSSDGRNTSFPIFLYFCLLTWHNTPVASYRRGKDQLKGFHKNSKNYVCFIPVFHGIAALARGSCCKTSHS